MENVREGDSLRLRPEGFSVYERPGWDEWAMGIARAVSLRGDCTRRRVGAVLLDARHRVIGCGYNGGPSGGPSCLKGECPRGRHFDYGANGKWQKPGDPLRECFCGNSWPCPNAAEPGSSYDNSGPHGSCISIHAEINCILDVSDRRRIEAAVMYVTAEPCTGCRKIIANTSLSRVVWPDGEFEQ